LSSDIWPWHRRDGTAAAAAPEAAVWSRSARWGLAAVLLLFAYEWLISGLNKVLSPDFRSGLADNLRQAMKDNPNHWYVHFLSAMVLPHAHVFAAVVEGGELLVAAGLVVGAALWIGGHRLSRRWAGPLHLAVLGALLGSALMTANYYLMAGNTLPWVNPGNPFNEGLDIDGLLTLVALALLAIQFVAMRAPLAVAPIRSESARA